MILERFGYISLPGEFSGVEDGVRALLTANSRPKTLAHILDVAEMNVRIGEMHGLDREKCAAAALLHDISAVIKPADMLEYARESGMELCEAELAHPFLLHQRMSALVAAEYFGVRDPDVLSPVSCHTTLRAGATAYDMALFIADKLAWDQEGVPPFYDDVAALLGDLPEACLRYMDYMQDSGRLLFPHKDWIKAYEFLTNPEVR